MTRIAIERGVPCTARWFAPRPRLSRGNEGNPAVRGVHHRRRDKSPTQPCTGRVVAVGYAGPVPWYSTSARHRCLGSSSHPLPTWRIDLRHGGATAGEWKRIISSIGPCRSIDPSRRMRLLLGVDIRNLPRCGRAAVQGIRPGIAGLARSTPPVQKEKESL